MPAARATWTVEMLDALPEDGQRYEIVDGELFVTPAPSDVHQLVVAAFFKPIDAYLRTSNVARALFSPADVRKDDRTRNRVQPDVFAVRLRDGRRPPYPYALSDLLPAVEVESPSNPLLDYQVKRELYQRMEWHPRGMTAPLVLELQPAVCRRVGVTSSACAADPPKPFCLSPRSWGPQRRSRRSRGRGSAAFKDADRCRSDGFW